MKRYVIEYDGKFYKDYIDLFWALPEEQRPKFDDEEGWYWEKWFAKDFLKLDVQEHTLEN